MGQRTLADIDKLFYANPKKGKYDWDTVNFIRKHFKEKSPRLGIEGMAKRLGLTTKEVTKIVNGDVQKPTPNSDDEEPPMTKRRRLHEWKKLSKKSAEGMARVREMIPDIYLPEDNEFTGERGHQLMKKILDDI